MLPKSLLALATRVGKRNAAPRFPVAPILPETLVPVTPYHIWKATREAVSHNHSKTKSPELAEAFTTHLTQPRFLCSLLEKHGYYDLYAKFKWFLH